MVTVQTAYEQLMAERYLYAKPRIGYFVDPNVSLLPHSCATDWKPKKIITSESVNPDRINFSTSGVDMEQFPFTAWAKLSRQILTSEQEKLLRGVPSMGLDTLRQAIAEHLYAYRNMQVEPEQILIGAGTEYLLGLLVQLLGSSRRYGVEDPGYHKVRQILRANGASVIAIPMDESGIRMNELECSGVQVVHVTPSHQFPMGQSMPLQRRRMLLTWLSAQPDRYLIEDDYDSELRWTGKPLPALYSLDKSKHVIYMSTFARTLTPSLRIGYVVLPPKLAQRYQTEFSFYSCTVPNFEQYTLTRFLQEGY